MGVTEHGRKSVPGPAGDLAEAGCESALHGAVRVSGAGRARGRGVVHRCVSASVYPGPVLDRGAFGSVDVRGRARIGRARWTTERM